ncbi:MAG: hypothetical protein V4488_19690 [Pseudomonadota bacterium]
MLRFVSLLWGVTLAAAAIAAPDEGITVSARDMGYPVKLDISVEVYSEAQADSFVASLRQDGLDVAASTYSVTSQPLQPGPVSPGTLISGGEHAVSTSKKWLFKLAQLSLASEQQCREVEQKLAGFLQKGYSTSWTLSK